MTAKPKKTSRPSARSSRKRATKKSTTKSPEKGTAKKTAKAAPKKTARKAAKRPSVRRKAGEPKGDAKKSAKPPKAKASKSTPGAKPITEAKPSKRRVKASKARPRKVRTAVKKADAMLSAEVSELGPKPPRYEAMKPGTRDVFSALLDRGEAPEPRGRANSAEPAPALVASAAAEPTLPPPTLPPPTLPPPTGVSATVESPRSNRSEEGAVLVTGICGRLGRLLARTLHRQETVVGLDRRPFHGCPKDIVHHRLDMRRKKTRDLFRRGRIRAVVHLGVMHDPRASDKDHHSWNVVAFQKLLTYLAAYKVPKLVVLSSANVYGPQADNPQFLTEDAPLLGAQRFGGIRDLIELDMLAQSFFWRHPDTETVILRPCHILGAVRNAPSNFLRLPRPMTVMGHDPMVQPIHERDVVRAIKLALEPGQRGIYNLRGPGELPLSRALRALGRNPYPVPSMLAKPVLKRMFRYRLTSFPSPQLDHVRFVCMVDDSRARNVLGFEPRFDMAETIDAVNAAI